MLYFLYGNTRRAGRQYAPRKRNAWRAYEMYHIVLNLSLTARDAIRNILRSMISGFGILFIISFMVMYLPFRDSVKSYIETNLFGKLAINEVKIYPRSAMDNKTFSPSAVINSKIPPAAVRAIRNMPELKDVHAAIKLNFRAKVHGELMGHAKAPHVPVCGIDREFFRGKMDNWAGFRDKTPLPVVIPRMGIELFNNFLQSYGVQQLKEKDLRGFPLKISIHVPNLQSPDGNKNVDFQSVIYSFSDALAFPAAVVPSDFITAFAARHKSDAGPGFSYIMVYASVRDVKKIPEVTERIRRMGLAVESSHDVASKTNSAIRIIDGFSLFVGGALLIIIMISIFNSYLNIVYTRSHKFSLQRIIGVSKLMIIAGFVAEAAVVGAAYGVAGYYLGTFLLEHAAGSIPQWIPGLSNVTVSAGGGSVFALAFVFSVLISSLSALVPAIFAANLNLFKQMKR